MAAKNPNRGNHEGLPTDVSATDSFTLPRIKVCGLARVKDAQHAMQVGAEALGVVQYPPSPRSVDAATAAKIFAVAKPNILTVAVLVNLSPDDAFAWAETSKAKAVQLCGTELAAEWRDFPLPILRRIGVDQTGVEEMAAWSGVASGFVLDHPSSAGGSGQTVDYALAAELCERAACLLAGGLHGGNVAEAVAQVQPAGVDASSRLEDAPGRKNFELTSQFVQNAQLAFAALAQR
ncbi:MAG: phosphoribosylanthranilate isomerase [Planctomycetes bacterium]|nr:phosphoribosylanthranilate isomerase [Planctomycetota bacterium]